MNNEERISLEFERHNREIARLKKDSIYLWVFAFMIFASQSVELASDIIRGM